MDERSMNRLAPFAWIGSAAIALLAAGSAFAGDVPWGMPANYSSTGGTLDWFYELIFWVTGVIFVITEVLLIVFVIKYRFKKGRKALHQHGSYKVEITWTIVTTVILVVLTVIQIPTWFEVKPVDAAGVDEMPVRVRVFAKQFEWRFWYAGADGKFYTMDDVYTIKAMTVPVKMNIALEMRSQDVIHSLFLPHMRFKQDIVPGITVYGWIQAIKTTDVKPDLKLTDPNQPYLDIACAELCGINHHTMRAQLRIFSDADFNKWLAAANALIAAQLEPGEKKDEEGKTRWVNYQNDWDKWKQSDRTIVTPEDLKKLLGEDRYRLCAQS